MFQVIVTNPTPEARAILGNTSGVIDLDIINPEALRLTKEVERLNTDGSINVEGVLNMSFPYSRANNAALMEFLPDVIDQRYKYLNVRVMADNIPANFDRLYVVARNTNDKDNYWECELRRPLTHWVELASEKKLNTIDCGTFEFTESNIVATWLTDEYAGTYDPADNDCALWVPMDFGGWVDLSVPGEGFPNEHYKTMISADIRPIINVAYLLKRGFCEIGYEIKGRVFDTIFMRSQWAYILSGEYYAQSRAGILSGEIYTERNVGTFGKTIKFDEVLIGQAGVPIDGGGGLFNCGVTVPFPPEVKVSYRFTFAATFRNDLAFEATLIFYVQTTDSSDPDTPVGEVLTDQIVIVMDASSTKQVQFEFVFTCNGGDDVVLAIFQNSTVDLYIEKGGYFRANNETKSFVEGDTVTVKDCIHPDYTLMDLLKGTIHIMNGQTDTDLSVQSLEIVPESSSDAYGENIPGFIINGEVYDISQQVVEGSIKDTPIRKDLNRYTRIGFKNSTDAYIAQNEQYEQEPPHSRLIQNGVDLPDEVTEFYNPFFEPTIEGQDMRLKGPYDNFNKPPMLPRLWDNTNGARSFNIGPRIFWSYGNRAQLNPNAAETVGFVAGFLFNSGGIAGKTAFGYASQRRTWELLTYGTDGNLVFGNMPTDLFNLFYLGFFQQQQYSRSNNLLLQMNMADYTRFKFRALYYYTDNGRGVFARMMKVSDFAAGASFLPTPIDMQRAPALSACCDLPCGCRFTECEYYQDLGPQVRQATLDTLKISSFVVDGKEYVTSDVSLGIKNVIVVNGKQYLTNLVDALNTIGAPYFLFSYSTRVSTAKGLRFFKIKRPSCQSFEIVVEQSGTAVYRYTEAVQEQKWFSGSFEPFSYGAEEYGEPENCINTIEY